MAVPTSNLSISNLHTEVGGGATAEATLDDLDIRAFGNAYANPTYNVGTSGVPLTQGTEIALGEFRGAAAPSVTQAFVGTYTHNYNVYPGGQYTATTVADTMTAMSQSTFTGNLMGVNATHTITQFRNSGISNNPNTPAGIVSFTIQNSIPSNNPIGAYSNSGWSSIQFGYYNNYAYALTLLRSQASSFTTSSLGTTHSATYEWGTVSTHPTNGQAVYSYNYATYFGGINNYNQYYRSSTEQFRMLL